MSYELVGEDSAANSTATAVLVGVVHVLHVGSDETMGTEQVTLQALVGEESPLTPLTVQRRPVCEHLRVNSNLKKREFE